MRFEFAVACVIQVTVRYPSPRCGRWCVRPVRQRSGHLRIHEHAAPFGEVQVSSSPPRWCARTVLESRWNSSAPPAWLKGRLPHLVQDHRVQTQQAAGDAPGLALRLLLFQCIDQVDRRVEAHALAMLRDAATPMAVARWLCRCPAHPPARTLCASSVKAISASCSAELAVDRRDVEVNPPQGPGAQGTSLRSSGGLPSAWRARSSRRPRAARRASAIAPARCCWGLLVFSAISDGTQSWHWRGGGLGRPLISLTFLFAL